MRACTCYSHTNVAILYSLFFTFIKKLHVIRIARIASPYVGSPHEYEHHAGAHNDYSSSVLLSLIVFFGGIYQNNYMNVLECSSLLT